MTVQPAPTPLSERSTSELSSVVEQAQREYDALVAQGLSLDLTRGKPSTEQLDLSNGLLTLPSTPYDADGVDTRNYGGLTGIREIRELFAPLLGVGPEQLLAGGNSSLTMMYDSLVHLLLHGGPDSPRPWRQEDSITFVCPVPGYDRHFAMLEDLGITMVTVDMAADGPDMNAVEALVHDDPSVKGIWVVPTYSNPTGATVSIEVANRLASMKTAAPDFRIFWDNAYALHHLSEDEQKSADILGLCSAAGNPNRPFMFASTSKVSFAGAGVAFFAASDANRAWYLQHQGFASIGPDKVNQLRHVEFFGSPEGVVDHMGKQRDVIAPKFAAVQEALGSGLEGLGIATWSRPGGGYFVNVDVLDGCAAKVVDLAKAAGIALTPAGSAFPHGDDPRDRNIRLAPTFPPLDAVRTAMAGVATCITLACSQALLDAR